jgi:hypothetical protein
MAQGLAILAGLAAQALPPPYTPIQDDAGANRYARTALEQLLAEAEHVRYMTTFGSRGEILLHTRGRATNDGGVCARERVTIEVAEPLAPVGAGATSPARIGPVKTEKEFWVLRDEADEPRWTVTGADLARACVGLRSFTGYWVSAESSFDVRWASQSLLAFRDQLTKPDAKRVKLRCERRGGCPADGELLHALRPLEPFISVFGADRCDDSDDRRCYVLTLFPPECRFWELRIETDADDPRALLSAVLRERPSSCLHRDTDEPVG